MDNELKNLIREYSVVGGEEDIDRYLALRDERVFDRGYLAARTAVILGNEGADHNRYRARRLAEEGR